MKLAKLGKYCKSLLAATDERQHLFINLLISSETLRHKSFDTVFPAKKSSKLDKIVAMGLCSSLSVSILFVLKALKKFSSTETLIRYQVTSSAEKWKCMV